MGLERMGLDPMGAVEMVRLGLRRGETGAIAGVVIAGANAGRRAGRKAGANAGLRAGTNAGAKAGANAGLRAGAKAGAKAGANAGAARNPDALAATTQAATRITYLNMADCCFGFGRIETDAVVVSVGRFYTRLIRG